MGGYAGETSRAVLRGDEDPRGWTDEELERGRKRSKRDDWSGRPVRLVPKKVHDELVRRTYAQAETVCHENVVEAVKLWGQLVRDEQADMKYRLRASENIADRVLGRPPQRHEVAAHVEVDAPWVQALKEALVPAELRRPEQEEIIDAELVDEEPAQPERASRRTRVAPSRITPEELDEDDPWGEEPDVPEWFAELQDEDESRRAETPAELHARLQAERERRARDASGTRVRRANMKR